MEINRCDLCDFFGIMCTANNEINSIKSTGNGDMFRHLTPNTFENSVEYIGGHQARGLLIKHVIQTDNNKTKEKECFFFFLRERYNKIGHKY